MMAHRIEVATAGRWNSLLVVYWLAMFIGTHIPSDGDLLGGSIIDKFLHFGAFAVLAMLVLICWQLGSGNMRLRHYLTVCLVLAGYGAIDELLQIPVGRVASVYDWIADVAGGITGVALFHFWKPWILAYDANWSSTPGS